jgi:two-component system chemotaxis response regulator CheB
MQGFAGEKAERMNDSMPARPQAVVVIGASAGGVEAIQKITDQLPADFPAAVLITIHVQPSSRSRLPELLNRHGRIPARHASHNELLLPGNIYIAPPDHHLLLRDGHIELSHGPHENNARPAIDPLFRTAAWSYGPAVIGVLLTGHLGDGSAGMMVIKSRGGTTIVQDPQEAVAPSMPLRAIAMAKIDHILPLDQIPQALVELAGRNGREEQQAPMVKREDEIVTIQKEDRREQEQDENSGDKTFFTCPECGGVIWQSDDNGATSFVCHTGHRYSPENMFIAMSEEFEQALWRAIRILKERSTLSRQVANRVRMEGDSETALIFDERASSDEAHTQIIQDKLLQAIAGSAPAA